MDLDSGLVSTAVKLLIPCALQRGAHVDGCALIPATAEGLPACMYSGYGRGILIPATAEGLPACMYSGYGRGILIPATAEGLPACMYSGYGRGIKVPGDISLSVCLHVLTQLRLRRLSL